MVGATREHKLAQLEAIDTLESLKWEDCSSDWHAPLLPKTKGDFFEWPLLIDLFPYQRSGSKFGRSWPIGETEDVLRARWHKLMRMTGAARKTAFKNNKYRKIEREYRSHVHGLPLPKLADLPIDAECPTLKAYAFRSFDRHWAIEDIRFNDRMGETLWRLSGDRQLYLTSLATEALGIGQGIVASANVPDLHHFRGSFGGKDVIPLYRDAEASKPNVTANLLTCLSATYGFNVSAEDLAGYVYALLGGQSYAARFWNELETPGARVPITKVGAIFNLAAELGRRLIWLHTYAERFRGEDRGDELPFGTAKNIKAVSDDPVNYPGDYAYDPEKREVRVGDGRFGPVAPEVWEFEISGLKVVQSWLG